MKTEIKLLREIADAAKDAWNNGWLSIEAIHLKNLMTDRIDKDDRAHNKALHHDRAKQGRRDYAKKRQ